MLELLTTEDISNVTEMIMRLTSTVNDLSVKVDKLLESNKLKSDPQVSRFKSKEDVEEYCDSKIREANIPNLTEVELTLLKSKRPYYIYDILQRCASEKEYEYLSSLVPKTRTCKLTIWITDISFFEILDRSLKKYIRTYLTQRYSNLEKLEKRRAIMKQAAKSAYNRTEETITEVYPYEFKKALSDMIQEFKNTEAYADNYKRLNRALYAATHIFTEQELTNASEVYMKNSNKKLERWSDAIAYVKEYSERFLDEFSKALQQYR